MNVSAEGCFYCRNHRKNRNWRPTKTPDEPRYACALALNGSQIDGPKDVPDCPEGDLQAGFQIGGYYRRMWFKGQKPDFTQGAGIVGGCLEWHIEGDAEFPHNKSIEFHLCDWKQLEEWVAIWGKELRRRGWVVDKEGT